MPSGVSSGYYLCIIWDKLEHLYFSSLFTTILGVVCIGAKNHGFGNHQHSNRNVQEIPGVVFFAITIFNNFGSTGPILTIPALLESAIHVLSSHPGGFKVHDQKWKNPLFYIGVPANCQQCISSTDCLEGWKGLETHSLASVDNPRL